MTLTLFLLTAGAGAFLCGSLGYALAHDICDRLDGTMKDR